MIKLEQPLDFASNDLQNSYSQIFLGTLSTPASCHIFPVALKVFSKDPIEIAYQFKLNLDLSTAFGQCFGNRIYEVPSHLTGEFDGLTQIDLDEIEIPTGITNELETIFRQGQDEYFEDGMESEFSRRLTDAILKDGELAVKALLGIILNKKFSAEVASEALRWVGSLNHPRTKAYRLWLLANSLKSSSMKVRDGAIVGLASMGSPIALQSLERALTVEKNDSLKRDLQQVIDFLKAENPVDRKVA